MTKLYAIRHKNGNYVVTTKGQKYFETKQQILKIYSYAETHDWRMYQYLCDCKIVSYKLIESREEVFIKNKKEGYHKK